MIEHIYRLLTDKKVRCQRCSGFIGYVWRKGHAAWLCAGCAGGGEVTAVNV